MQKFILKISIFKENYQRALNKLTLLFLSNPVLFSGQDFEKQKRPESSDQSLFSLQNKSRKTHSLVMYYLTLFDDEI